MGIGGFWPTVGTHGRATGTHFRVICRIWRKSVGCVGKSFMRRSEACFTMLTTMRGLNMLKLKSICRCCVYTWGVDGW